MAAGEILTSAPSLDAVGTLPFGFPGIVMLSFSKPPTGGIIHTADYIRASYGYFVRGQSSAGGRVFASGEVNALVPIEAVNLHNPDALHLLGDFEGAGENPMWAYASLDAAGPVPFGVFKKRMSPPDVSLSENKVILPKLEGVCYFYTTDGSDPYADGAVMVEESKLLSGVSSLDMPKSISESLPFGVTTIFCGLMSR